MTIDDDSLLSAYMDGQLDPDQLASIESALVADSRLGEELRSLTAVRDLVAGLPRPAAVDVTSRVRDRIRGKSRVRRILSAMPGRVAVLGRPRRAAGVLGIAAGLLVAFAFTFSPLNRLAPRPDRANPPGPNLASSGISPMLSPGPLDASESRWPLFAPHSNHKGASSPSAAETHRSKDSRRPAPSSGSLEHVSQYLDNPDLRQMFLVSDIMDDSARQVASVVEQTTQFNYYKITIAQGIVIDPRHPDEATVFALVVNPNELNSLRDRLRTVFRDRVEESPVDPKVVTQLADIGHVQAYSPSPTADVVIPRESMAILAQAEEGGERPASEKSIQRDRPTPEQERSSPAADLAVTKVKGRESRELPGPADSPDRSFVVLVWVSRPRSG